MRNLGILCAGAALAAMSANLAAVQRMPVSRPQEGRGVKDWRSGGTFDPRINRHTGHPHQHQREIARRLRQQARRAA